MANTIVITGAAGSLGRKLWAHFDRTPGRDLRLLDIDPGGQAGVITADLSVYDEAWAAAFAGAEAVVHLAAQRANLSRWDELIGPNIDAMLNVYLAAARHGVKRVVFASSVWTMANHRFDRGPITADPSADPGANAYGASKLFGERVGKTFFDRFGVTTVALRIGACRDGVNQPTDTTPMGDWNQNCWLSDRDFLQGVEKALTAEVAGFAVLNLVSDNPGSRWTLDEAARAIGYRPQDGQAARLDWRRRMKTRLAKLSRRTVPDLVRRLTPDDW